MIKRIYIFIFLVLLITSCGKKGDPVYNEKNSQVFSTQIRTII